MTETRITDTDNIRQQDNLRQNRIQVYKKQFYEYTKQYRYYHLSIVVRQSVEDRYNLSEQLTLHCKYDENVNSFGRYDNRTKEKTCGRVENRQCGQFYEMVTG